MIMITKMRWFRRVRVGDHEDNETIAGVSSVSRSTNFMINSIARLVIDLI